MLAEKLKEIRKQRGITQEEVAKYLDVKRQTYGAYERGVSNPDPATLKQLSGYFGVSVEYFFRSEESDPLRAQTEEEERLLILSRRAEKVPAEQRQRIIRAFEEHIDIYLDAINGAGSKRQR